MSIYLKVCKSSNIYDLITLFLIAYIIRYMVIMTYYTNSLCFVEFVNRHFNLVRTVLHGISTPNFDEAQLQLDSSLYLADLTWHTS